MKIITTGSEESPSTCTSCWGIRTGGKQTRMFVYVPSSKRGGEGGAFPSLRRIAFTEGRLVVSGWDRM